MPTIQDLFYTIDESPIWKGNSRQPGKNVLFRPCHGAHNFVEIDRALLRQALQEIVNKLPQVQAGLDDFSATEKIMFLLIKNHAEYGIP